MKSIAKALMVIAAAAAASACTNGPKDGEYQLDLLTTNDVHGSWFDSTYVGGPVKTSLMAVNSYVTQFRDSLGKDNVLLIDAGDCLQGDNAAYYYNYVDTLSPHLFTGLVSYMGYEAIAVGNHDIETGHPVYDRIARELDVKGIPFLGGNAFKAGEEGRRYFPVTTILKKNGLKVAVLGYTNPNIRAWLDEGLWSGIEFKSLIPVVQEDVDEVIAKEHPHAVIVAVHSGTGDGDGTMYESQGRDLLKSLRGVDFLICSHDHRALTIQQDSICLINAGSHAKNIGHGRLNVRIEGGKVVSRELSAELIKVDARRADTVMREHFRPQFEKVKAFTVKEVGTLDTDLVTRDSYQGMCPYMNLIHTLSLSGTGAQISFAAPLTFNRTVKSGKLIYNDLFTIYPYENQLFTVKMTGQEIKDYLEYSYDMWIQTPSRENGGHALKIRAGEDQRTGQQTWHFIGRSYNFDSAAGLDYTVDITRPAGSRVSISGMADGGTFCADSTYTVAMTSYRASGGGGLMSEGAGISPDESDSRIIARYPEMRVLLYEYLQKNGSITESSISNPAVIGHWEFVPESAAEAVRKDMSLMFGF